MSANLLFSTTIPAAASDADLLSDRPGPGPVTPLDPSGVPTRELKMLCDELYSALDSDFPPYGVREDYAAAVKELEQRQARRGRRGLVGSARGG